MPNTPTRRVLIDHGAWKNYGDIAMLTGVCRAYQQYPDCQRFVLNDMLQYSAEAIGALQATPAQLGRRLELTWVKRVRAVRGYHRLLPAAWRSRLEAELQLQQFHRRGATLYDAYPGENFLDHFCRGFDMLHISGGNFLTDLFPRGVFSKALLVERFVQQGKPVLMSGQQFGPFRLPRMQQILARTLQQCDGIGIRESGLSARICEQAGVRERTEVSGDDSFGMPPATDETIRSVLQTHRLEPGRFLAINWRIAFYAPELAPMAERLLRIVWYVARELGLPVVFVPIYVGDEDSDLEAAELLRQLSPEREFVILDNRTWTTETVKGVLGQAYAGIGPSYHFGTFCLSQGIPVLNTVSGPYYQSKAQGLASFWGFPELHLPLHESARTVPDPGWTAFLSSPSVRAQLSDRAKAAREHWSRWIHQAIQRSGC